MASLPPARTKPFWRGKGPVSDRERLGWNLALQRELFIAVVWQSG